VRRGRQWELGSSVFGWPWWRGSRRNVEQRVLLIIESLLGRVGELEGEVMILFRLDAFRDLRVASLPSAEERGCLHMCAK